MLYRLSHQEAERIVNENKAEASHYLPARPSPPAGGGRIPPSPAQKLPLPLDVDLLWSEPLPLHPSDLQSTHPSIHSFLG